MLKAAHGAAKKMTTHENADTEIRELKKRYDVVKAVADTWEAKVDVLLKEWVLLDTTVSELNSWVAKVMLGSHWSISTVNTLLSLVRRRHPRGKTSSPSRRWSPPWESSRIYSRKKKSWLIISK